jgi:protoporphyrinogen oxidase
MSDVVVVGAGVAGLTIAHELARRGRTVTVLERGASVGGLARTFRYGDFFFDVGPHRFHTDDADVAAYVRATAGDELLEIPRSSAVRAFGRHHAWPLRASAIAALPPRLVLRVAGDLLRTRRLRGESFEAEVVNRYGPTLYESFFAPYTRRFLGVDPALLHRDWARAGMDRAVIDARYAAGGLRELARSALGPRRLDTRFLYPADGIGRFADRLAAAVTARGGRVLPGREVSAVERANGRVAAVHAGGERFAAAALVWTAPVGDLARLAGLPDRGLELLSTLLYNVELRGPARLRDQWVYYGGDEAFVRISVPALFSRRAAPPGRGSLCVERTCRAGDARWDGAERDADAVVGDLVRTGAVASAGEVAAIHVERVRDTYPVYALGYRDALAHALRDVAALANVVLAGRGGRFWYNNMDHSIGQGLRVAAALADGRAAADVDVGDREFWVRAG